MSDPKGTIRATGGRERMPDEVVAAEITQDGYLRLPPEVCAAHFRADRCVGIRHDSEYVLLPATVYAQNGMIMKQRNPAGQRSVLIREVWGDDHPVGAVQARWQPTRRRLVITGGVASPQEAS